MNQIKYILILLLTLLIASGFSYPNNKGGNNMELIKTGYIEISGGCEVYEEAKITFSPNGEVILSNKGGWFWKDNNSKIESFSETVKQKELTDFFNKLDYLINNKKETDSGGTRNATVKIYLPFKGKAVNLAWNENDGYEIDPLLDLIDNFILAIHP